MKRNITSNHDKQQREPYGPRHWYRTSICCGLIILLGCFASVSAWAQVGSSAESKNSQPKGIIRLPESDVHGNKVKGYIEVDPIPEYKHASEAAYEAFRDMKYGVRIHWGLYSINAYAGESWPLLKQSFEEKQKYQELYKTWNPQGFNADEWMELFQRNGLKMFAFTSKHHEGFSMYDTKTRVKKRVNWTAPGGPAMEDCDLAYSIMETPFKRDIMKELCDAAHKRDIKIDLYFSHPDWYDADFRPYNYHPAQTPDSKTNLVQYGHAPAKGPHVVLPDLTPAETERMIQRHRAQLKELLTNYGKIDMICLDQWMGPNIWPAMRQTMLELRRIQPDVMFRCRGIRNYGDYYTPEGFVPGSRANTDMPWFVIYPMARSFSYVADPEKYKGGDWIINNVIDTVAKGGNFMVAIGPDKDGRFHQKAIEALEYAGAWLKINGEAIYKTRPREGELWKEGENIRFTRTKDNKYVYIIALKWPGETLQIKLVKAKGGSTIRMLGLNQDLKWRQDGDTLVIELPKEMQDESKRPCKQAYAFKVEPEA